MLAMLLGILAKTSIDNNNEAMKQEMLVKNNTLLNTVVSPKNGIEP
jgi:hypothetical protein